MTRRGAGEGSIRTRKDGTFEARLVVEGKRVSLYGDTRREVQQKLSASQRLAEQGKLLGQSRQTVSQYLDHWLSDHVALSRRPKTVESYQLNIKRLTTHLGTIRLDRLKPVFGSTSTNPLPCCHWSVCCTVSTPAVRSTCRHSSPVAAYLVLTQLLGAELRTFDGPLARNARGLGLPVHLIE